MSETLAVTVITQELEQVRQDQNRLLQKETLTEREVHLLSEYESLVPALETVIAWFLPYKGL